ncbi:MAG: Fe-only nitrogenase subunit delta [Campylobacteraceae bacterium]
MPFDVKNASDEVLQLEDYIMKNCLWQFHSRAWDRERQNKGILTQTMQILCGEDVEKETPEDKCYWVDAFSLAHNFKKRFEWLSLMSVDEIKVLMQELKERIDYVTITGSLNKELTSPRY